MFSLLPFLEVVVMPRLRLRAMLSARRHLTTRFRPLLLIPPALLCF
jgi:hypothetical protein